MNTRRVNLSLSFAASVLAPLAIMAGCSGEKTNGTDTMPSASNSSGGSSTSVAPTSTNATTSTGASGTSTGNTSTGGSATSGGSGASTSGGSGASTSGGSGGSSSGSSGASTSGGSGASTSGGSGTSSANSGGSDSANGSDDTSGPTGSESGETSGGGGDFALTAPWSAKDTCTPEANETCDNIEAENRATMIGGDNVMPTFEWSAGPEGTMGYALVFQDLSFVQQGKPAVHWAMWNVPGDVLTVGPDSIPEAADEAAGFNLEPEWFGSGACGNVYQLSVFALSAAPAGTTAAAIRDELEANMGDIVLDSDYARVSPKDPCN